MAADIALLVSSYFGDERENKSEKYISTLLEGLNERQSLQDSDSSREWAAKVNSLLNSKTDRWLGISLLETTLQQCDTETFTTNCNTWIKAILQIFQSTSSRVSLIQCCVHLLDDLVRVIPQFPDLSRTVSNSIIPSIISALLSLKNKDVVSTLSGICTCVRYMPGPVGQFRGQIESCLVSNLETWNANIRKHCSICFALLAGCNNSSAPADKQKTNWEIQWNKVLTTVHYTVNNLYGNIEESTWNVPLLDKTEMLPISIDTEEEPLRTNTLTARLRSLLSYLDAMTREGTQRITSLPIDATITTLERILSVHENMLTKRNSIDVVLLKTCLSVIHVDVVTLLCSLILRCGSLLLLNADRVAHILVQELCWTSNIQLDITCDRHRPYRNLRCAAYECFIHWEQLKAGLGPNVVKKVIQNIMADIKPHTSQTKLIAPKEQKQPQVFKKAKKRKLQDIEQLLITGNKNVNPLSNASVCHKALSALYVILMRSGIIIPKEIFQEIQAGLLYLVLQCQRALPRCIPPPYINPDCRKQLYCCLLACALAKPPQAPSVIQCAIRCFTQGLQDTHYKVSSYCKEALTISTAMIHPSVPSLGSAVQFVMVSNDRQVSNTNHTKSPVPFQQAQTITNDWDKNVACEPHSFGQCQNMNGSHKEDTEIQQWSLEKHSPSLNIPNTASDKNLAVDSSRDIQSKISMEYQPDGEVNNTQTLPVQSDFLACKENQILTEAKAQKNDSSSFTVPSNTNFELAQIRDNSIGSPITSINTLTSDNFETLLPTAKKGKFETETSNIHVDSVQEMLASFVDCSPDSESE